MDVLLASTNPHKVREFRRLLDGTPLRLLTPLDTGFSPLVVPEEGQTFAANAEVKASAYLAAYSIPVLADDSGISVNALAGAPGVRSARFGSPMLDDTGRLHYLLAQMEGIPDGKRGAHYTCCLVLARPGQSPLVVSGYCYGVIGHTEARGATGFGYDPIFIIPSLGRAIADLTPEQKDRIGHRGKAVHALLATLRMGSRE